MPGENIEQMIEEIKKLPSSGKGEFLLCHAVIAPLPYDIAPLEAALQCVIPEELYQLWRVSSSLRVFVDLGEYGQVGLVTYPPTPQLLERNHYFKELNPENFRPGDLILGEFYYESDLLVIRCNPAGEDYGHALMALPIYPRGDWPFVGNSLASFLRRYVDEGGKEFWPR